MQWGVTDLMGTVLFIQFGTPSILEQDSIISKLIGEGIQKKKNNFCVLSHNEHSKQ